MAPQLSTHALRAEARRLLRPLFAACLALALLAPTARAFQVARHSNLTSDVLFRHGVSGSTLDMILQGVRWPDINQCWDGCYCPSYLQWLPSCPLDPNNVPNFSVWHYDNNMISESMTHVNSLMDEARAGVVANFPPASNAQRKNLGEAMMTFGKALHGIQDFYAHSSWIELNLDLIRIGGTINSCPMWNGEMLGGTVAVGGGTIQGLQTGFVELPTPPGSTTHDALNKDAPGTAQGSVVVNGLFPAGRIGSYYEIASGQVAGGPYLDTGLAPQHTLRAWDCLWANCAVYSLPAQTPPGAATAARVTVMPGMAAVMSWINSSPEMVAIAATMAGAWAAANPDSPSTYPGGQFDADGWPLPATASVNDLVKPTVRWLQGAWPNPAHGVTAIRFFAPEAAHARLEIFDLLGRRVSTLIDEDVTRGWKEAWWDGSDASGVQRQSGVYRCRLTMAGRAESSAFSLIR